MLLEISNQAAATSGITRKKWQVKGKAFHHLVNPHSPDKFPFDLKSVSVVAKNTLEADVWAKTLFLMGKKSGLEFSQKKGIKSIFLDYKGNVFFSPKAKENILIF